MGGLASIGSYIEQTANIIGGALDLDVLIVDDRLLILGDSNLESVAQDECLRSDSILARVMEQRKTLILENRDTHEGCLTCAKREYCHVTMIIGIPIVHEHAVIGSIGVIANGEEKRHLMLQNRGNYLQFIDRMIELMINKLTEEKAYHEVQMLHRRLEVIIDAIEHLLVLVSSNGEILQVNKGFQNLFQGQSPDQISELLDSDLVDAILSGEEIRYKEVQIKGLDFILNSQPIDTESKEAGYVLTIRSLKDLALEMTELYSTNLEVAFDDFIGKSPSIRGIKEQIRQIASSSSTVLINGETGTGKEVIARLIHNTSDRKHQTFVAINCSAIPEDLMESELFGYEEGAFSGAKKGGKIGKFHLANGGTIFLDEIGEMALNLQSKLLRVLQDQQVTKVGGLYPQPVDVRIIAATNRNLERDVKSGMFREDLYYRLKVIPIYIPPLRERKEDLLLLIDHFLHIYSKRLGKSVIGFSNDALKQLLAYPWKGNVRELRNVIEYAINMTTSKTITVDTLPSDLLRKVSVADDDLNLDHQIKKTIQRALERYGSSTQGKERAAETLGISLATLYRKLKEYENYQ